MATLSAETLSKRAAQLAACEDPVQALEMFDEVAREVILDSHDEDMRCGGLERVFPTAESGKYSKFFDEESYFDIVLRRWHEAGGGELFRAAGARSLLPPWLPRQVY